MKAALYEHRLAVRAMRIRDARLAQLEMSKELEGTLVLWETGDQTKAEDAMVEFDLNRMRNAP